MTEKLTPEQQRIAELFGTVEVLEALLVRVLEKTAQEGSLDDQALKQQIKHSSKSVTQLKKTNGPNTMRMGCALRRFVLVARSEWAISSPMQLNDLPGHGVSFSAQPLRNA